MSYATLEQYRKRLDRFYDQLYPVPDDPETEVSADPEQDLADASAEIDAKAAVRYGVPLPAGIQLVANWTMTLAEELAWSRDTRGELPKNVTERCKVVRKQLDDLAAGKLTLVGVDESTGAVGGSVIVECEEPLMTRGNLAGY